MLLFLLLFYSALNFIVSSSLTIEPKVIGGSTTSITRYPFIVSIQRRQLNFHTCGGTYIAPKFILTAAHCVVKRVGNTGRWRLERPSRFLAVAGTSNLRNRYDINRQVQYFDKFFPHIYYQADTFRYDIALCRMKNDFELTDYVQFAKVPLRKGDKVIYENANACSIAGWGITDPDSNERAGTDLYHAHIPLIPDDKCFRHPFRETQLCAGLPEGGVDTCLGDSGGPLVCKGTQVGVTSFGIGGCAEPGKPGYYTRIDYFLDWINNILSRKHHANVLVSIIYFLVPFLFFAGFLSILIFWFKRKT